MSLQLITVVVIFLSKWGSPGHTGWCRGMISGARDQARAPLKTTHDPHCFASHLACYLQLLPFCHAHRAAQYLSSLSFLPRANARAAQYFVLVNFITPCRASLAQPNILSSLISLLSATRLLRSPISCFRSKWSLKKIGKKTRTC